MSSVEMDASIMECKAIEQPPKKQKLCTNLMTMENDSFSMVLGSKGLIRKHEFVRVIVQCLLSLGFSKSASYLELESGILCKSKEFEAIESQIHNAKWEECMKSLNEIEGFSDESRSSVLLFVIKQYLLECLSHGDVSTPLYFLQKQVSILKIGTEKVHKLAFDIIFTKENDISEMNDSNVFELRNKLLVKVENLAAFSHYTARKEIGTFGSIRCC